MRVNLTGLPRDKRAAVQLMRQMTITLLLATGGGVLTVWLGWPLPWLLGSLLACVLFRLSGAPLNLPNRLRVLGQGLTGMTLGLTATPAIVALLPAMMPLALANAAFAVWIGWLSGNWFARTARFDPLTARCAIMPGGVSEMVVLAERHGARPDQVAAARALRVLLVASIVPALFSFWFASHGEPWHKPPVQWALLWYLPAAICAGYLLYRVKMPNAAIIGPLLACALLSASGLLPTSSLPDPVSNAGQLLLGASMGCRFLPGFLQPHRACCR